MKWLHSDVFQCFAPLWLMLSSLHWKWISFTQC